MAITIKDVAKAANVAPSTVSRVIADSPRISEETKKRVREVMDKLGYHPNFIARSLASQSTQVIGIVFPSSGNLAFQNPFYSEVLRGISEGVHQKHYSLQLTTGKTEDEIYDDVVKMVQGRRVDGIILLYSKMNDKIVVYLRKNKFPFVLIGKPYEYTEQITHVDNDNISAAKEGTEYLIKLGHSCIGFIGGNKNLMVTNDRLQGYKKALMEAGIELKNEYVIHENFLLKGGQVAVRELLSLDNPPTALLVVDDLMSLGVLRTTHELGLNVPEDISIVSFNNALFAELSNPALTSIDINILSLGMEAVKNLIGMIENPQEPTKRIIIPHQIIERSSCGTYDLDGEL
ncbi:LacI family DNA-binding transcriptional regulator [Caldibacillus lycopersici]|uniref:LacI family DNA-binding transcriptional regulator n=1 Tax=Perspicuibacillus lycopersici TaxID=1325689 RepID=A0AAE3LPM8_9BACI|nr:LacI family DNA-binding transcriptional regulator [Perspicuibacillus lycopersici]MCU9612459.1 LacI family DNA-binding transcriptional regulator [Perspicuibacillus lycopersici]